jgi:hypothetical protein
MVKARLGDKVDTSKANHGPPPVILRVQPDSYFRIETPEELKHWQEDVSKFLGVANVGGMVGAATESCSCGCSDDCDQC